MQRLNFTLDDATVTLLEQLASRYYRGNKSQTVRAALESLAARTGHEGWVVGGYMPVVVEDPATCHTCGEAYRRGAILYRPVFARGDGPRALPTIPQENWLDCAACVVESTN